MKPMRHLNELPKRSPAVLCAGDCSRMDSEWSYSYEPELMDMAHPGGKM